MRVITQLISGIALAGTIVPSLLYLAQKIDLEQATMVLTVATFVWFVATPFWMGRKREAS